MTPLREWETNIETLMRDGLETAGLEAVPQFPAGSFIIDFAILEPVRIAIECDGEAWHSSPAQRRRDGWKTHCLKRRGWIVVRFSGSEIESNVADCVARVQEFVR